MHERWWTGIVKDKDGLRRRFAIYGDVELDCRERVEKYGYEIVEMRRDSSYKPPEGMNYIFRCVPDDKDCRL